MGDQGIIAPWIQGVFNEVSFWFRKLDDLIMDALLQPDFYQDLMTFCLDRVLRLVEQYIAADVDVLSAGGNIANGKLVGREFFAQHIAPYERQLIEFIQERGKILKGAIFVQVANLGAIGEEFITDDLILIVDGIGNRIRSGWDIWCDVK